jgi:hypothetical protein
MFRRLSLLLLLMCPLWVHAQNLQAGQFPGNTVGDKILSAQTQGCISGMACVITIGPELSVWSPGVRPTKCAACTWLDFSAVGSFTVTPNNVQVMNSYCYADTLAGADWAAKANTANSACPASQTIFIPSDLAGAASTTFTPSSQRHYVFDAGQFSSSASPMVNIAAGTQALAISGAGQRVTKFVSANATADYFQFNGTSPSNINDVTLEQFSLETTVTRTAGYGFNATYLQPSVTFQNIRLIGLFNGWNMGTGSGQWVIHDVFATLWATGGTDLTINPGNGLAADLQVFNYYSDVGSAGNTTSKGFNWLSGNGVNIGPIVGIVRHGQCLTVNPATSILIQQGFFLQFVCDVTQGNDGIHLGAGAGQAEQIKFEDSWSSTATAGGNGLYCDTNSYNIQWLGGWLENNAGSGAVINTSNTCEIIDATITGNSLGSVGTNHGVVVTANMSNFVIRGNQCRPLANFGNTQGWGIIINTGSSDNYIVKDNNCTGNVTGGIVDGGTGTNKQISGNLPPGAEYFGGTSGKFKAFASVSNCQLGGASGTTSPAACGSAPAGTIAIPASLTSYTVTTSAVTANSVIIVQQTTDNSGIPSSPTCSTTQTNPLESGRAAGTNFGFTLTSVAAVSCYKYWIIN